MSELQLTTECMKSVLKLCKRCGEENLCKPTAKTCNKCFNKPNNEKLKERNYFNENSKKYYKYTPILKTCSFPRTRTSILWTKTTCPAIRRRKNISSS